MALLSPPLCDFGWKAPDFELATPSGERHSPSSAMGENGLLVMFICNHCPYVKGIADRLAADCTKIQEEGIGVLAVMSNDYNDYAEDSPERMLAFAQMHGFTFPYLVDEDQSVGRTYGAVCTPDFFGFNSKSELQYRGRFDSLPPTSPASPSADRTPYLLDAMRRIAETGEGPREQIASAGCSIKWRG